jgi:hypothetical protein
MEQKQQLSAKAEKVLVDFITLSENEKIQVLNRAGVWYLRHKGALVTPMPEMREILQGLARLSWLSQRVFILAQNRNLKFNMQLLQIISKDAMQSNVVEPVTKIINSCIKKLEQLIAEAKKEVKNG